MKLNKLLLFFLVICCINGIISTSASADNVVIYAIYNDDYLCYLSHTNIITKQNYHKISDAYGSPYLTYEEILNVNDDKPDKDKPLHNDKNDNFNNNDKKPVLNENNKPVESDKNVQNDDDINYDEIYWLARIIEAEAAGEPYKGKLAVGSVIMNRVKSKEYPSTIYGVIFDQRYGVQFTPTINGTIYNEPSAESVKASKEILTSGVINDRILYFVNHDKSKSEWFKTKNYVFKIGNHTFYSN